MAGPWEEFQALERPAPKPWEEFGGSEEVAPQEPKEPEYGDVLPLRYDADGTHFDTDAGILGILKRAFLLPSEVLEGKVDMNTPEGIAQAIEMAATLTPGSSIKRAGAGNAVSLFGKAEKRVTPPTAEQLKTRADASYDQMRASGAEYSASDVAKTAQEAIVGLNEKGLGPNTAKKTNKVLKELANPPERAFATASDLQSARSTFGNIAASANNGADRKGARLAKAALDRFISDAAKLDASGKAAVAAQALKRGDGDYAAAKRSELINGINLSAERRAAAANSGSNVGNTARQKAASALEGDRKLSGFNEAEIAGLEGVVQGSAGANTLRNLSGVLGGGGGVGATMVGGVGGAAGTMIGGLPGAVVGTMSLPALGALARNQSNRMTLRALEQVDQSVRKRSPLFEEMYRDAPLIQPSQFGDVSLMRLWLSQPGKQE